MSDEYGDLRADGLRYTCPTAHALDFAPHTPLEQPEVSYQTWGTLNAAGDNAVVVCHALTGNASAATWWSGLIGAGKPLDPERHFIVCANILGSCYGSTGPQSINPATGRRYGPSFPMVAVRDTVRLHARLVFEHLGVRSVAMVIGGSLGGMQTLEWGLLEPARVRSIMPMACGAFHHPWQIAISEAQRQAIYADPKWRGGDYPPDDPPVTGLAVARQFAMVSYRSHPAYLERFGNRRHSPPPQPQHAPHKHDHSHSHSHTAPHNHGPFEVESYLQAQGEKFKARFDALAYVRCTQQMDLHDVGRGRGSVAEALRSLPMPVSIVGIDSDVLYPIAEQQHLHALIPNSSLHIISSPEGHDGFLLEQKAMEPLVRALLEQVS